MNAPLSHAEDDGPNAAPRLQVAALCHRGKREGRRYLLVTSRDTGRWIIPKGWPIDGLTDAQSALQEAWEEAGVVAERAANDPVGVYHYDKRQDDGGAVPVEARVFSVAVADLAEDFPEADERTRKWVTADAAARMVEEEELQAIFRDQ